MIYVHHSSTPYYNSKVLMNDVHIVNGHNYIATTCNYNFSEYSDSSLVLPDPLPTATRGKGLVD